MTDLLKVLDFFTYQTTEIDVVQTALRYLLPAQAGKNSLVVIPIVNW